MRPQNEILVCEKRKDVSPEGYRRIDVTSHATDIFCTCSPFLAGPVSLYGDYVAKNVENAWQYAKVYPQFIGADGTPTEEYFEWAKTGWSSKTANRYPMGRKLPKFSWWDGEPLDYIDSRKQIYIPLYSAAVIKTPGFQELKHLYEAGEKLCLLDYDAYDFKALGYTMTDIINDPSRVLGHSFVLKGLLEGTIPSPIPFRVIIAGSRDFNDYELLKQFADSLLSKKLNHPIEIVCGEARGADSLGKQYAIERGYTVKSFPAQWNTLGKRAGMIRNQLMADYADACIAFWDGKSHGTKNMIDLCKQKSIPIRVKKYGEKEDT